MCTPGLRGAGQRSAMYPAADAASSEEKPRPCLCEFGLRARPLVAGSPMGSFRTRAMLWAWGGSLIASGRSHTLAGKQRAGVGLEGRAALTEGFDQPLLERLPALVRGNRACQPDAGRIRAGS